VLRVPVPSASATGLPSVKARSGWWQVAHETVPVPESRRSKKSDWPSVAARGSSAKTLVGSGSAKP
jgi:hypothetical protein